MSSREASGGSAQVEAGAPLRTVRRAAAIVVEALDLMIAAARKTAGFAALLDLGWVYFRLLVLGEPLKGLYPGTSDPDLAHRLWVLLMLIAAQGWDIPVERIRSHWARLRAHLRAAAGGRAAIPIVAGGRSRSTVVAVVIRLGRFMDLCVAIANKVGAFAALCYLLDRAALFFVAGVSLRRMYPSAHDPLVSAFADFGVLLVVLGWWAAPFEQIGVFWRRLRAPI